MRIADVIQFVKKSVPMKFYANDFSKSDESDCGFIRIDGGGQPDMYIVGIKEPSIQIVIRHSKGSEAERISHDIWNLFHGKEHYSIGSTAIKFSYCNQSEPIYVGVDKNGRTIYSVNATCKIIE